MKDLLSSVRSLLASEFATAYPRGEAGRLLVSGLFVVTLAVPLVLPDVGHAQFTKQKTVNQACTACEAQSVYPVDVNADGHLDVLSASEYDDKIAWYPNEQKSVNPSYGAFNSQRVITTNADGAQDVFSIDLDEDGDPDVLSASKNDDTIAWYENKGGSPPSFTRHVISTGADQAQSVYAANVDGEGGIDVLSASKGDNTIAWYENDGSESFAAHDITTNASGAQAVFAANLDGDGDVDVLSASKGDDTIAWYENDGTSSPSFTSRTISSNVIGAESVYAINLDGETGIDVLGAGNSTKWFENDGAATPSFTSESITATSGSGPTSVVAADVDGDNDSDVLTGGGDDIVYSENDGASSPSFTNHDLSTTAWGVQSVHAANLTESGDKDVLFAATQDDEVAYYANSGDDSFDSFKSEVNTVPDLSEPESVFAGDLENDGDVDVAMASAADDHIAWYERSSGSFSAQKTVNTPDGGDLSDGSQGNADDAQSVAATDLDGDNDQELFSASARDDKVAWYENESGESGADSDEFRDQLTITTNANGAWSVYACDETVAAASVNDDKIALHSYSNGGFSSTTFTAGEPISVYRADLDGDGGKDILYASSFNNTVGWYNGSSFVDITTTANNAESVYATDLDGDSDLDVLSASKGDNTIAWYENDGTSTPSFTEHLITTSATGTHAVHAADLDGDGKPEVISGSSGEVAWYRNEIGTSGADSDGFNSANTLTTDVNAVTDLHAADVGNDGDPDVFSASRRDDKIAWYENKTPPIISSATTADGDGNGQIDQITIQFSETVDITDGNASDALPGYSVDGYTIADADYGATGVSSLTLTLIESGSGDTGTTPLISYDQATSNNPTVANGDGTEQPDGDSQTPSDGAAPVGSSASLGNDGNDNLAFSFDTSEQLDKGNSAIKVTVDGPTSGTDWKTFTDADFSKTANGDGTYTYALSVSQGYNDGDGTYTAKVDDALDAAGNDGADGSQTDSYTLDTTAPTVSNVTLGNDGNDNLTFSFDTDEQLDKGNSAITVTVDGPTSGTDWKTFTDADFSEMDNGSTFTYELSVSPGYTDGAGSYTAAVDDAIDADGNDGADGSQTASYAFTADVAVVDGRDGEAYAPPSPSPGTNDNPIGRLKLSADVSGSSLSSVTITQDASSPSGVNAIELWRSPDNTFESKSDTELASKSYADNVSFSVSSSLPTGGAYFFVAVDLASDASGDYNPKIASESNISFTDGTLSSVNGTSTTSFTDAYLSSSSTALPVELARFDAARTEEGVVLTWRTASEKNNAGFRVQRNGGDGVWTKVGWMEGEGTRSTPKTYRFSDEDLPYAADTLRYRLTQVDIDGTTAKSRTITVARSTPKQVELLGTFPNPMQSRATLRYALPEKTDVQIVLYDVMGRRVRTVAEGSQKAGRKQIQIASSELPSGVYFLRLKAGAQTKAQRLTVVR